MKNGSLLVMHSGIYVGANLSKEFCGVGIESNQEIMINEGPRKDVTGRDYRVN